MNLEIKQVSDITVFFLNFIKKEAKLYALIKHTFVLISLWVIS